MGFTLNVCLRNYINKRGFNKGTSPVLLDAVYRSRHHYKSLSIRVRPNQFQNGTIVNHPNAENLNRLINLEYSFIQQKLLMAQFNGLLSKQFIQQLMGGGKDYLYPFLEDAYNSLKRDGVRRASTIAEYEKKINVIKLFSADIPLKEINKDWLLNFRSWLRERGNKDSSIRIKETMIAKLFSYGVPHIWRENPYHALSNVKDGKKVPVYLTDDERMKVKRAVFKLPESPLKSSAMRFLLDMEIGLRVGDLLKIDPSKDIKDNKLIISTQKAGTIVSIPLSAYFFECLEYCKAHPANPHYNTYLKHIRHLGELAGISKKLTSHVARHTLGHRLAKARVNIKVAQKILGHKSLRSTEIYYHIDDEMVSEAMERLNRNPNPVDPAP